MLITNMVSVLSSPRGLSLRERMLKFYMALLSMSDTRSKFQPNTDTLKSVGVDPVEAKAKRDDGSPTSSYPCYPPWDEDKTFRKSNAYTYGGFIRSDWRTELGLETGGKVVIWWND